jgi:rod shape-determining protein MreC
MMFVQGKKGEIGVGSGVALGLFGRIQNVISTVFDAANNIFQDYVALVDTEKENKALREENERLLGEALKAKQIASENEQLHKLLGLKEKRKDLVLAPAKVIGAEISPFFRVVRVVIQTEDEKVDALAPVIAHTGLVGRVVRASSGFADVMLLTDRKSKVSVEVLGKGILGVVAGTGKPDEQRIKMQVSQADPPIEAGATIITSGHDRVFPRGIEVGYVVEPEKKRVVGPFIEYDVVLATNVASVNTLFIVLKQGD